MLMQLYPSHWCRSIQEKAGPLPPQMLLQPVQLDFHSLMAIAFFFSLLIAAVCDRNFTETLVKGCTWRNSRRVAQLFCALPCLRA